MKPISKRNQSAYKMISTTMRITVGSMGDVGQADDGKHAALPPRGTGFLFDFSGFGDHHQTVLVTNRHCLKDKMGRLHKCITIDYAVIVDGERRTDCCEIELVESSFAFPRDENIDLAAVRLDGLFERLASGVTLDHYPLTKENLPNERVVAEMDAIERVLMIGYPVGIMDEASGMPIARMGITAMPYFVNYDDGRADESAGDIVGPSDFALDIEGTKGSSGSPVFLADVDKYGIVLLGVDKQNRFEQVPTNARKDGAALTCSHPFHMAIGVKAHEILSLEESLKEPRRPLDVVRHAMKADYDGFV